MAIRHGRGRKATMPQLLEGQFAVTKDTEEVFAGIAGKNVKVLDEKDKTELLEAIDNVEVDIDTTNLATKPELNSLAERSSNYFYQPTKFPAVNGTGELNAQTIKSADIYNLYDGLVNANKQYITKTLIGKDMSNTKSIYEYVFEPKNYKNTLVIGSSIHGHGTGGDPKDVAIAVYYFMKDLCENWLTNDKLSFLRWNTRIVVVPIWNPWGFDNDSRYNVNGVDINRNFDYLFDALDSNVKGSAPFSEIEARHIRDLLIKYSDTVAYLDCHCWADTNKPFQYIINHTPAYPSKLFNKLNDFTDYLVQKYQTKKLTDAYAPSPSTRMYAENVLNIPTVTLEFVVFPTDRPSRTSEVITQMVEWYGGMAYLCVSDDTLKNKQVIDVSDRNTINLNMTKEHNTFSVNTKNANKLSLNFFNPSKMEHVVTRVNFGYLHDGEVTFPSNVFWKDGNVPTFTNGGRHILEFESFDGGMNWFASSQGMWVMESTGSELLKDDFNRANTTSQQGLGIANTGQAWTHIAGGAFVIRDNKAKAVELLSNSARDVIDPGKANIIIKTTATLGGYIGVLFRYKDDNNRYTFVMNETGGIYILRHKDAVSARIAEKADYALVKGKTYNITIKLLDDSITVLIDDVLVLTVVSSDFMTATKIGFSQNTNIDTTYDDLIVENAE